ncbi:galactoside O-acetyltransferase [Legionella norrlandica]|uniref:Galactoside O-acetyltransferase n=1 Tax=Legionella norrlandica TaxID=1498499 RepID=A0A0A2T9C2_9GAMM|nr:acyltransferase [Legionella norrlandica]KGP64013.1 galactoside O-acetyltransferase [Legionella norrlandica]
MPFLTRELIDLMGFSAVGNNVQISDKASFYNINQISIGNNVRIDDFCVFSAGDGGIYIGDYVHIAVGVTVIGAGKITISSFCGLSSRVAIYSSSDDYSGLVMTNPTIPAQYKRVAHANVFLGKHVIIGSGSIILPGVTLENGVAVGALSLIAKDCSAFGIYAGSPAKRIKERSKNLLQLEEKFLSHNTPTN